MIRLARYNPATIAVVATAFLAVAVAGAADHGAQRFVRLQTIARAEEWAEHLQTHVKDLATVIAAGDPTPAQRRRLAGALQFGGLAGVALYDAHGALVTATSRDGVLQTAAPGTFQDAAARAVETASALIPPERGSSAGMPLDRTEVYVPVIAREDGAAVGAIGFTVDATDAYRASQAAFRRLGLVLAGIIALGFGIPAGVYALRRRAADGAWKRTSRLGQNDAITRLLNRASFLERLAQLARSAKAEGRPVGIVSLDIDRFKSLNQIHGRAGGDAVLKHAAAMIRGALAPADLAARFGDDEFVIARRDATSEGLAAFANGLISQLRMPLQVGDRTIAASISAGGVVFRPARDEGEAEAVARADVARYQAKLTGKGRFLIYRPEFETSIAERQGLEQRILAALEDDGFVLYFQPLVDQRTRSYTGFEALLRLPDGTGGFVSPGTFIPVAEDMGAIDRVGTWVLREGMRAALGWPSHLQVSINLSPRQFEDGALVTTVKHLLAETGLPASRLMLEVTESLLIGNSAEVAEQLMDLRMLGVSIAMDDFGTGYSSLGYLWKFGFDKLKIDRSFVSALSSASDRAEDILGTIIMLGHKLDMRVLAEGIETATQAERLAALGCDEFQGYFFGCPMPGETVNALLGGLPQSRRA